VLDELDPQVPTARREHLPHRARLASGEPGEHRVGERRVERVAGSHRVPVVCCEGGVEALDQVIVGVAHAISMARVPGQTVPVTDLRWTLLTGLEIAGIGVAALSGALLAVRRGFDLVGMAVLATLTGLGGGIARDVIIGATPPVAFARLEFLLAPLIATAVAFVAHGPLERISRSVLVFDAAALGLFAVTGTAKALAFGLRPAAAVLLGSLSAVGGGLLRDVCAREIPYVFRADGELYAIPAVLGATVVAVSAAQGFYGTGVAVGAATGVFGLRVLALRFRWPGPRPRGA
jgi:uncharacterized membrane protein YeiH